jgi:hypothetical protein
MLVYTHFCCCCCCVVCFRTKKECFFLIGKGGRETLMLGGNERIDRRAGWRLEKQVFEICEVARLDKDHWRARRKAIEVSLCKLVSP